MNPPSVLFHRVGDVLIGLSIIRWLSDPDGKLPKNDFVGWVLQIPENESVATTKDRIYRGIYDFNASKKGRLLPVKTVGEAIENVPAKHFKEAEVWVKTKTPVLMVKTNNEVPKE